jgi:superfamily II DNA or RNA helicase
MTEPSPAASGLRGLGLGIHYEGRAEAILAGLVLPALSVASRYDRLTGYFNVASLVAISQGVEGLWRRKGHMRLVVGIHDLPAELLTAAADDWPDMVIADIRRRLIADVTSLGDELARDRLATLAWMMQDGLLQVRVAAPATPLDVGTASGIFHSKRLIFSDSAGDVVSAVGSPNETGAGLGINFEELTVHMSWQDGLGYVATHSSSFDRIWLSERPGLTVRELDAQFAGELEAAARRQRPTVDALPDSRVTDCLDTMRRMPVLATLNLGPVALYPHQERTFMEVMDRWPIRALLADEVGLGKTLEAGAVLAQLIRLGIARKVVVLAPKNVTRQWRDEMKEHFGLDFWLYESAGRFFESSTGDIRALGADLSPVGSTAPSLVVVSAQLARGTGQRDHVFAGVDQLPDVLLVDEAHAARVRMDLDGTRRPTRLWSMLSDIADRIPHLLLVTATPLQLDWIEYFSLLELLGLPSTWDARAYERSLQILAKPAGPTLNDAHHALDMTRAAVIGYELDDWLEPLHPEETKAEVAMRALRAWDVTMTSLMRAHPASVLTLRNSRAALEHLGYRFPARTFDAPPLDVDQAVRDFYEMAEVYLRDGYGMTEQAAMPDRANNLGFAKSTYYQRMASSLIAAERSIRRRLAKLESIDAYGLDSNSVDDSIGEVDEADVDAHEAEAPDAQRHESERVGPASHAVTAEVSRAIAIERMYLTDLTRRLDLMRSQGVVDPKVRSLIRQLATYLPDDKILVFSRYTDTVASSVAAFVENWPAAAIGYGIYTGEGAFIDTGNGPVPVTKQGVREALDSGQIRILFCSDAASEGLNLQSARVIINVDVPWNPARLEQRIGRIARLGQTASEVAIVNLWYPDSVEAKMYSRLLVRRDLYQLAVGSMPELVADAIRQEVRSRLSNQDVASDPLVALQRVREEMQLRAIERVWARPGGDVAKSESFRLRLAGVLEAAVTVRGGTVDRSADGHTTLRLHNQRFEFTTAPGASRSLSLAHPLLDVLARQAPVDATPTLFSLECGGIPLALAIRRDGLMAAIPASSIPGLIGEILGLEGYSAAADSEWATPEAMLADVGPMLRSTTAYLPPIAGNRIPRPTEPVPRFALGPYSLRQLGDSPAGATSMTL